MAEAGRDVRPELIWEEYFMTVAAVAAKRSKLPNKDGAVIVTEDNRIVGTGYNGTPLNHPDPGNVVVDAATNAILFRNVVDLRKTEMYTTAVPSLEAAVLIVQSRIRKLHYLRRKEDTVPQRVGDLFSRGNVELHHYIPNRRDVTVNFAALGETSETALPRQSTSDGGGE